MKSLVLPSMFLMAVLMLSVPSCTKEYIENINGVCFEQDVLPVFVSNCTQSGCHNQSSHAAGYDLTTYENIISRGITPGSYQNSHIYHVIASPFGEEAMPPPPHQPLTTEQITNIALWIEQGANNTTCSGTVCDTTNVSFAADILPVMQNYCNGCHSGSAPSGNIDLTTYTNVKNSANSNNSLVGSITHASGYKPMPDGGGSLPNCDIAKIKAWVNAGTPNN
ncbi:MAG: c-type cytochrome [Lewinellaceae bacterium]|nr:c-type cytochrome [Lewinellaceae bacterium]